MLLPNYNQPSPLHTTHCTLHTTCTTTLRTAHCFMTHLHLHCFGFHYVTVLLHSHTIHSLIRDVKEWDLEWTRERKWLPWGLNPGLWRVTVGWWEEGRRRKEIVRKRGSTGRALGPWGTFGRSFNLPRIEESWFPEGGRRSRKDVDRERRRGGKNHILELFPDFRTKLDLGCRRNSSCWWRDSICNVPIAKRKLLCAMHTGWLNQIFST